MRLRKTPWATAATAAAHSSAYAEENILAQKKESGPPRSGHSQRASGHASNGQTQHGASAERARAASPRQRIRGQHHFTFVLALWHMVMAGSTGGILAPGRVGSAWRACSVPLQASTRGAVRCPSPHGRPCAGGACGSCHHGKRVKMCATRNDCPRLTHARVYVKQRQSTSVARCTQGGATADLCSRHAATVGYASQSVVFWWCSAFCRLRVRKTVMHWEI